MARLEITSFAFMLVCVPDPVCQTTSGKLSSNLPSITSLAAAAIAVPRSAEISPWSMFTSAQAFLITPRARTMAIGCFSQPMGKLMMDRWVCAPQYLLAGTSKGPKLSVSTRMSVMAKFLTQDAHLMGHGAAKIKQVTARSLAKFGASVESIDSGRGQVKPDFRFALVG